MCAIELKDVTFRRRNGFKLGPLSTSFSRGITCIVGANGAGKSTLFEILFGGLKPNSGVINFANTAKINLMPQELSFPSFATSKEFLTYIAWLHKVPKSEISRSVDLALLRVDLSDQKDTPIKHLSGGMKRRLGLAQTLINSPNIILLDEPTVGLDPVQRMKMRELILHLSNTCTVLLSTHLIEDVALLSNSVLVLNEGEVRYSGDLSKIENLQTENKLLGNSLENALAILMG